MAPRLRPTLLMMSGLPGVGKSTIATELGRSLPALVLSVDEIEDAILRAGIAPSFETGLAAYEVGAALARQHLGTGQHAVADAANFVEAGRAIWRAAADAAGARVVVVDVTCSDEALHRQRLRSRRRGLTHYPELSWDDVVQRRAIVEPWTERAILCVDSVGPIDEIVNACLEFIERHGTR